MNNMRLRVVAAFLLILLVVLMLFLRQCGRREGAAPPASSTPASVETSTSAVEVPLTVVASPTPAAVVTPSPKAAPSPRPKATPTPSVPVAPGRPKVEVFPELIPKDITIVRVYYANMIVGPGDIIEFDINGSGFTKEFHRSITVQAGRPDVDVQNLELITPNQIHGRLVTRPDSKTDFSFPTVSIKGKVVFQAPEPFAVIRPGEVLNLVFTEMGESGRTGRFRVFTNLTPEMFQTFKVTPSTTSIQVNNLTPLLPFVVEGSVVIGPALTGDYGMRIALGDKVLWERPGIIRIVQPNLGQTGLVQRLQPEDFFHRPGDTARFIVQGSGFQFQDTAALSAEVKTIDGEGTTFLYLAPGRLALDLRLPANAPVGDHGIVIRSGDTVLLDVSNAFRIVPKNWTRTLRAEPPLKPGTASQLVLSGRDLEKAFIDSLSTEVDEEGLVVGKFVWVDAERAVAPVEAKPSLKPGDYQVRIRANGQSVVPHTGDIVEVVR